MSWVIEKKESSEPQDIPAPAKRARAVAPKKAKSSQDIRDRDIKIEQCMAKLAKLGIRVTGYERLW